MGRVRVGARVRRVGLLLVARAQRLVQLGGQPAARGQLLRVRVAELDAAAHRLVRVRVRARVRARARARARVIVSLTVGLGLGFGFG